MKSGVSEQLQRQKGTFLYRMEFLHFSVKLLTRCFKYVSRCLSDAQVFAASPQAPALRGSAYGGHTMAKKMKNDTKPYKSVGDFVASRHHAEGEAKVSSDDPLV